MDTVKVDAGQLLEKVTANREAHFKAFTAAFQAYREECQEQLRANLDLVFQGKRHHVLDMPPENHTKAYDRVIAMLGMSQEAIVELSAQDFERYVLDNWEWKEKWVMSNTKYLGG